MKNINRISDRDRDSLLSRFSKFFPVDTTSPELISFSNYEELFKGYKNVLFIGVDDAPIGVKRKIESINDIEVIDCLDLYRESAKQHISIVFDKILKYWMDFGHPDYDPFSDAPIGHQRK